MTAATILDFQVMYSKFGKFCHVNSVVLELYIKFGSNICDSHWDQHTYAPDIHLMTSRELTSNLDFWSAGHLRMAVVHLTIKFGVDICIQSCIQSLKFKMAAAAILDFQFMWISPFRRVDSVVFVFCTSLCEFGHSRMLVVWYLCSVPNLVTEIDAFILQTFIWFSQRWLTATTYTLS